MTSKLVEKIESAEAAVATVWNKAVKPAGTIGLTLFGFKVFYTLSDAVLTYFFGVKLPTLPY